MGGPDVGYGYHEPDARDPNYDEVAQGDTVCATVVPELEEDELEQNVQPMVLENCEHGDTGEVVELLRGLNLGGRRHAVPELAVEGRASHRELLSELVGRVLSPEDVAWAFDEMLRDPPDLILDTPEAPQMNVLLREYPLCGEPGLPAGVRGAERPQPGRPAGPRASGAAAGAVLPAWGGDTNAARCL